jgi:hypothetical protein
MVTNPPSFSLRDLCKGLDEQLAEVAGPGLEAQPDSRAVGAYAEKAVLDAWPSICERLDVQPLPPPGRRTIYDAAFRVDGALIGIDVRSKDLDEARYADGGICSVGNLLRLLTRDLGVLVVAEFGYREEQGRIEFAYARTAPLHCLPVAAFRIENLGTGQVRLDKTVGDTTEELDWTRPVDEFLRVFSDLAIDHYERVERVARERAEALAVFQETGDLRLK